jgi:hypothetical protein
MSDKVALITGVTGQDGAYLAEFLLGKGYVVHGIKRRASSFNSERIDHLYRDPHDQNVRFTLHYGDMTDATNLIRIIQETQPTEIYNLAAQSHVQVSFETPEYTANADALVRYVCLKQSVSLAWKNVRTGSVRMPTLRQMETLNMDRVAPILIRIYKEENTLEVWKQNRTGRFALLKSYPICKFSGKLGPKIIQAAI